MSLQLTSFDDVTWPETSRDVVSAPKSMEIQVQVAELLLLEFVNFKLSVDDTSTADSEFIITSHRSIQIHVRQRTTYRVW